jgi:hypothetical protein
MQIAINSVSTTLCATKSLEAQGSMEKETTYRQMLALEGADSLSRWIFSFPVARLGEKHCGRTNTVQQAIGRNGLRKESDGSLPLS